MWPSPGPDHWFKNVFVLPGVAVALAVGASLGWTQALDLLFALIATSLIASANYTINEYLDAESDRHHPIKSTRPSALGRINPRLVVAQWLLLGATGLVGGFLIQPMVGWTLVALLVMGVVYNVEPVRSKDRPYFDVISESVNNPLRFLVGWYALLPEAMPPASVLLSYWMGGAFLMAIKRYAEYRFIDDPERAALYRRSFGGYDEATLLQSSFLYAILSSFFLGVFLIKYRIEFIMVSLPFFALLFVWYSADGHAADARSCTDAGEVALQRKAISSRSWASAAHRGHAVLLRRSCPGWKSMFVSMPGPG